MRVHSPPDQTSYDVNAKSKVPALSASGSHQLREAPPRSTTIAPLLSDERNLNRVHQGQVVAVGQLRKLMQMVRQGEGSVIAVVWLAFIRLVHRRLFTFETQRVRICAVDKREGPVVLPLRPVEAIPRGS
jgi:hypothetical protein